jgi:hypothetical protein
MNEGAMMTNERVPLFDVDWQDICKNFPSPGKAAIADFFERQRVNPQPVTAGHVGEIVGRKVDPSEQR